MAIILILQKTISGGFVYFQLCINVISRTISVGKTGKRLCQSKKV